MRRVSNQERKDCLAKSASKECHSAAWCAKFEMDECRAHSVLSSLQLALRHPLLPPQVREHVELVAKVLALQLSTIGPSTAAIVAAGWINTGITPASALEIPGLTPRG
jgi:hypothetical protein